MNILITICARGGSKGIPGKNIKMLNGKPLIGYTIDIAKRFQEKHGNVEIALFTDSEEIMLVAELCGLHSDLISQKQTNKQKIMFPTLEAQYWVKPRWTSIGFSFILYISQHQN